MRKGGLVLWMAALALLLSGCFLRGAGPEGSLGEGGQQELIEYAEGFAQMGDPRSAASHYSTVVVNDPENAGLRLRRAKLYEDAGDFEQAARVCEEALLVPGLKGNEALLARYYDYKALQSYGVDYAALYAAFLPGRVEELFVDGAESVLVSLCDLNLDGVPELLVRGSFLELNEGLRLEGYTASRGGVSELDMSGVAWTDDARFAALYRDATTGEYAFILAEAGGSEGYGGDYEAAQARSWSYQRSVRFDTDAANGLASREVLYIEDVQTQPPVSFARVEGGAAKDGEEALERFAQRYEAVDYAALAVALAPGDPAAEAQGAQQALDTLLAAYTDYLEALYGEGARTGRLVGRVVPGRDGGAASAADDAPQSAAGGAYQAPGVAQSEVRALYTDYLKNTLLAEYGAADLAQIRLSVDEDNGLAGPRGLVSVHFVDLGSDGYEEMVTAALVEHQAKGRPAVVMELGFYTVQNGQVYRIPADELVYDVGFYQYFAEDFRLYERTADGVTYICADGWAQIEEGGTYDFAAWALEGGRVVRAAKLSVDALTVAAADEVLGAFDLRYEGDEYNHKVVGLDGKAPGGMIARLTVKLMTDRTHQTVSWKDETGWQKLLRD